MNMTATSLVWDPFVNIGGTSLQGYYRPAAGWAFEETVARLKAASGQEPSDGAGDKTSVEVVGRFDGAVFALYDYKGDRELHIGGPDGLAVARLQAALDAALAAVDPAPYRAVEPEAYGGVQHGWPTKQQPSPAGGQAPDSSVLWSRFLYTRLLLIHAWVAEGKSFSEIARILSMDPVQVELISMTDPSSLVVL